MRVVDRVGVMTSSRESSEVSELQQVLGSVRSVLKLLDDQWDALDEHQRRSAVKLSLDTIHSYRSGSGGGG